MTFSFALTLGLTGSRPHGGDRGTPVPTPTPTPGPAARNAVRNTLPGFNNAALGTATGNTAWTASFVNESGAPITTASLVFMGWQIVQSGYQPVGNDVPTTAAITYAGTTVPITAGGAAIVTIPNDGQVVTDAVPLGFSIPAGATFTVSGTQTLSSGQRYARAGAANCGLAGVRTHVADRATLKRESLFFIGDSIMTNNSGAVYQASAGRCPCVGHSIAGTRASSYAAGFARTVALFQALGCTTMVSNFGTNTLNATDSATTIAETVALRDPVRAAGGRFAQATLLPRTAGAAVAVSALTSAGTTATASVPDAARFVVGQCYAILGANEAAYNGSMFVERRDLAANTVSFAFAGTGGVAATGSITARGGQNIWSTRELQVPLSRYEAGAASERGLVNAWIRGGNVDAVLDWGDAVEIVRDDGLWPRGGDKPDLPGEITVTVASWPASTPSITYVDGVRPTVVGLAAAVVQTGSQRGARLSTSSDVGSNGFSHGSLPAALRPGDTIRMAPGGIRATDDGLHPRTAIPDNSSAGSTGGQMLLVNATRAWIDVRVAAPSG